MRKDPQSLYQVLRVPNDAKPNDIERAYRRLKAELQKETTPPDPRLRVMIEHAHDVLMDPVRREAYDKEWFAPTAQIQRASRRPAAIATIAVALVAAAAGTWFSTRSDSAPRPAAPRHEVQNAVTLAVGRVHRIEMNGATSPAGLGFAIAEGTVVTSCEGLSPNAEVLVRFGRREAPVRVSGVDEETGLCKLTGGTVGTAPLELARHEPSSGDPAYAVAMSASGEVQLADTHFKNPVWAGKTRGFQAEVPPAPRNLGAPLLDLEGNVLGAASRVGGTTLYMPVPRSWLPEAAPVVHATPEPRQETAAPPAPTGEPIEINPRTPGANPRAPGPNISPERRERLEKAFRPPPTVPADL